MAVIVLALMVGFVAMMIGSREDGSITRFMIKYV